MGRLRTLVRSGTAIALAIATTASSGCVAYQSQEAPGTPRNLPVSNPVWTTGSIAGPHAEVVARVIAASGTAVAEEPVIVEDSSGAADPALTEEPPRARKKKSRVFVWVDEVVVGPGALDFAAGLTLTTLPLMRWHELHVRGEIVAPTGRVVASAEARSEVGVLFGWPMVFAVPMWTDLEGTGLVKAHVRSLTRAVLSSLVTQDEVQQPMKAPVASTARVVGSDGSPGR